MHDSKLPKEFIKVYMGVQGQFKHSALKKIRFQVEIKAMKAVYLESVFNPRVGSSAGRATPF